MRTSHVNFHQDTIREPDGESVGEAGGGGGAVIAVPPPLGWATTTAQTEDPAKRAPPSPPTESAIDMRGGGRRRDVQKERNLQSARCDLRWCIVRRATIHGTFKIVLEAFNHETLLLIHDE